MPEKTDQTMDPAPPAPHEDLPPREAEKLRKKEYELVGNPVRYYTKETEDVPHAGIITAAMYDPDSDVVMVNLAVFEQSGVSVNKPGVIFVQKSKEKKAHEEYDSFCVAAT